MNTTNNDVYLLNDGEKVKLSPDLAWLFKNDEDSKKKREDYVDEFFGLNKIDKMLNGNRDEKKEG